MAKQQGSIKEKQRIFTNYPKHYKVICHNDDFTPMIFVVKLLCMVFMLSAGEAERLMYQVHQEGSAVVGIYSYDIALSLVQKATSMASENGFPLRFTCEPE